ncbi:single-strand DNA-binding protein [Micromonospora coriariae]|uniref:Single-stranded DNA-binding protein n=1 Tax=Micromonospora coriariae TaxID=285665 RepID=A0A1C4WJH7_9ACTN|nr:single-stranded DNA-binding protein [Micromonospora coriariae]SCE96446.1 single-strand DNA-binding protein [Micromonospora coriariae]
MFDTYVTIVGNVLTTPEWRRTTQSNTLVANFKVASTARRLDRDSGRWVDGNSLRVRVNCWRRLAEGVASSVMVGDPVVVCGRLYTRDWTDDAGNHRTLYELEAVAVGHDLSRGRARFLRNRPSMTTSTTEDAEAESRVHGEPTEPVPAGQTPVLPDPRPLDDDFELPDFGAAQSGPFTAVGPVDDDASLSAGGARGGDADGPAGLDDDELALPPGADDEQPDDDQPDDDQPDDELGPVPDEGRPEPTPSGRGRRGRGRVPQPA